MGWISEIQRSICETIEEIVGLWFGSASQHDWAIWNNLLSVIDILFPKFISNLFPDLLFYEIIFVQKKHCSIIKIFEKIGERNLIDCSISW